MKRPARRAAAFAATIVASLLLALGAAGTASAAGDVDDFTFDTLTVDYTITRADDGTSRLEVIEEFVAMFPSYDQNRGMRRTIPDTYNGQPLHPRLLSITDADGNPRPAESDSDGGAFSMTSRADDYLHGAQTFVFRYTLENVTWTFPDTGQEFFWDVNGVDWSQSFGQITARLHVGPELSAALTGAQTCFAGPQGSTRSCDELSASPGDDGGTIVTAVANDVAPYETLSLAVGFADGTFTQFDTSFLASGWGWAQSALAALVAAVAGIAVWLRRRFLRDEAGYPTIVAQYEPPGTIDALQSAVLLGHTTRGIPAEVLEQAVGGSIRILEGHKRIFGAPRLTAELVDPSRADDNGAVLLRALFRGGPPGTTFEFGRTDTRVSAAAQSMLKTADRELARRGLRRPVPTRVRALPMVAAIVLGAGAITTGFLAVDAGVRSPWPWIILGVALVVTILVVGMLARRPLTQVGARTRDHLLGLKVFIEWAEADRLRMLQSPSGAERVRVDVNDPRQMLDLYESLLPYAVVFGQEKQWSQQLAVLYDRTGVAGPVWYAGAGSFDASSFASGIGSLSAAAASSSSTSGGTGGGGSAGGGGGGGGGGGV